MDEIENTLSETFVTKKDFKRYKSELFDKLDEIVSNTANTKQEVKLIENRVSKLESNLQTN
ncbi:MAG: hypothetical protein ACW99F_16055 [Candidatus Hodarchaeales archaeon]